MNTHIRNEWKIFVRFLKEQDDNIYRFFIKEAFENSYNILKHNLNSLNMECMSYNDYIDEKINGTNSCDFVDMLNIRNAWYLSKNNKLSINIDWRLVEELWLIYILENRNIFNSRIISYTINTLKRKYKYNEKEIVCIWVGRKK